MLFFTSRSLFHRDIAARNVLLKDGRVLIADFGLAVQGEKERDFKDSSAYKKPWKWTDP